MTQIPNIPKGLPSNSASYVYHLTLSERYKVQLERSAVKGVDGFKVEANGDSLEEVKTEAKQLYNYAMELTSVKEEG